jgi:hypothetical protein
MYKFASGSSLILILKPQVYENLIQFYMENLRKCFHLQFKFLWSTFNFLIFFRSSISCRHIWKVSHYTIALFHITSDTYLFIYLFISFCCFISTYFWSLYTYIHITTHCQCHCHLFLSFLFWFFSFYYYYFLFHYTTVVTDNVS